MERHDAVLDASFWINAERSGLTPYLLDYFRLVAPPGVARELAPPVQGSGRLSSAVRLFRAWQNRGDIVLLRPSTVVNRFDADENEAIALAQERGWALLIDDAAPRHYSRGRLGITVIDSPAFTVFLYTQRRLSYDEAARAIRQTQASRPMMTEAMIELEQAARARGDR